MFPRANPARSREPGSSIQPLPAPPPLARTQTSVLRSPSSPRKEKGKKDEIDGMEKKRKKLESQEAGGQAEA